MTDAEQWLADLEAKAKAATPGPWQPGEIMTIGTVRQANGDILADCRLQYDDGVKNSKFIAAANPAAVLRLVGMVRHLAVDCDCDEADQQMKAKLERLEKEADWLANHLNSTFVGQCRFCREGIKQCTAKCECTKTWRDLARKAVEKETCPKN